MALCERKYVDKKCSQISLYKYSLTTKLALWSVGGVSHVTKVRNFPKYSPKKIPWNGLQEIPRNGIQEIPRNWLQAIPRNCCRHFHWIFLGKILIRNFCGFSAKLLPGLHLHYTYWWLFNPRVKIKKIFEFLVKSYGNMQLFSTIKNGLK